MLKSFLPLSDRRPAVPSSALGRSSRAKGSSPIRRWVCAEPQPAAFLREREFKH